jgi:hypothetical protein
MTQRLTDGVDFHSALLHLAQLEPCWTGVVNWLNNFGVINAVPGFLVLDSKLNIPPLTRVLIRPRDLVVFDMADATLAVYVFVWRPDLQDRVRGTHYDVDAFVRFVVKLHDKQTHRTVAEALQAVMTRAKAEGY